MNTIKKTFHKITLAAALFGLCLTTNAQPSAGTGSSVASYTPISITLPVLPGGAPGSTGFTTNCLSGFVVTNTTIVTNTPIYSPSVGGFVTNYTTNVYVTTNIPMAFIPAQSIVGFELLFGSGTYTDATATASVTLQPSIDGTHAIGTNNTVTLYCIGGTNAGVTVNGGTNISQLWGGGWGYWLVVSNAWSSTNPVESIQNSLIWGRKPAAK
jgi:hypothetical protein